MEGSLAGHGIEVSRTGEATVTGTTIRRCQSGLLMNCKATVGKGCSISACVYAGIDAWKNDGGPGEVTVEEDVDRVCEGNNTCNSEDHGNYLVAGGGTITGVAEEKILRWQLE